MTRESAYKETQNKLFYSTIYKLIKGGVTTHLRWDVCYGDFIHKQLPSNSFRHSRFAELSEEFEYDYSHDQMVCYFRLGTGITEEEANRYLAFILAKLPERVSKATIFEAADDEDMARLFNEVWKDDNFWQNDHAFSPELYDSDSWENRAHSCINRDGKPWLKVTFDVSKLGIHDWYLTCVLLRYAQEQPNIVQEFLKLCKEHDKDTAFLYAHHLSNYIMGHGVISLAFWMRISTGIWWKNRPEKFNWELKYKDSWASESMFSDPLDLQCQVSPSVKGKD